MISVILQERDRDMSKKFLVITASAMLFIGGLSVAATSNISANSQTKSTQQAQKLYQNPKRYHQIHYSQIKPFDKVGYTLRRGYEGIKTWKVMHKMHTWRGRNYYDSATYYAVKRFQRRHHLRATGNVNLKTWEKMGLSNKSWYGIDSYIAPLGAFAGQGRKAHIEAMIKQDYKYMGKPWLAGCSSSPRYGVDCSGLVMQALFI